MLGLFKLVRFPATIPMLESWRFFTVFPLPEHLRWLMCIKYHLFTVLILRSFLQSGSVLVFLTVCLFSSAIRMKYSWQYNIVFCIKTRFFVRLLCCMYYCRCFLLIRDMAGAPLYDLIPAYYLILAVVISQTSFILICMAFRMFFAEATRINAG